MKTYDAKFELLDLVDGIDPDDEFLAMDRTGRADGRMVRVPFGVLASGSFSQGAIGAVTRTQQDKLREIFSVKDFGAKGDGTTSDGVAIQSAINACFAAGGGVVYFPPGKYRKSKGTASLVLKSGVSLMGDGPQSIVFHDDDPALARVDLAAGSNVNNVTIANLQIQGRDLTIPANLVQTNQSQTLTISGGDNIRLYNVTFKWLRYMATSCSDCTNVVVQGCHFDTILRDGCRFTNSWNVNVVGNTFMHVADDVVALHTLDNRVLPGMAYTVTGNTFEACQGLKILGAKLTIIANNVFRRMTRTAINLVQLDTNLTEGASHMFCIKVQNNLILDTLMDRGVNFAILVSAAGRDPGGLASPDRPGLNSSVFPYSLTNNTDVAGSVNAGMWGIVLEGNIVARTLPNVTKYSDWGFGQLFDQTGWFDPAVTNATFNGHAMQISGPLQAAMISRNTFMGGTGIGILLVAVGTANGWDTMTTQIDSNIFFDWPGVGISLTSVGSSNKEVHITNNTFDMDPYFRHADHNADGTWAGSGNSLAIQTNNSTYQTGMVRGNTFKNVAQLWLANGTCLLNAGGNIIYSGGVNTVADDALNKGVRWLRRDCLILTYDGDPASATYGKQNPYPLLSSTAAPTQGFYARGHFVLNQTPSISAGKVRKGWLRLTDGVAHVDGTDWTSFYGTTS